MPQLPLFNRTPHSLPAARRRGAIGATRAAEHADREKAEWTLRAMAFVVGYARTKANGGAFLIEDARAYAEESGFQPPPDGRAWGVVPQTLRRRGELAFAGYAGAKSSNGSPKCLWRCSEEQ